MFEIIYKIMKIENRQQVALRQQASRCDWTELF